MNETISMTKMIIPCLHTLPVEHVYRILDNLHQLEILFSFYDVCTRLNAIISTYHRYKTITTLCLSWNVIGNEGLQYLANIFKINTTLTTLKLQGNHIDAQGAQYLADILQNNKVR
ncbi:unnamed protein product [Rotaria sordida]|uniref:F-box domain-containing protein n=1 Tax=Rotaria sordida TaxID=392033 RepID=A0A814MKC6_9BILA|nr:unnamed protein product [Rotaria sordida]CAF1392674.1 unnamed protein product [Rotaria sordida]